MMRKQPLDQDRAAPRTTIAGWIVGRDVVSPYELVETEGLDAVLGGIEREGVVSLMHARLADPGFGLSAPESLRIAIATRARHAAARSLVCLAEARRIQQALDAAGIPAIWLKGVALGHWLYPQPHLRDTADIDLLLPDHATTMQAARVLSALGYDLPNSHIAGDLVVHELLAWSERANLELDLHWDLSNDALFAGRLHWATLEASAMSLSSLSGTARGLGVEDALLHAVMHRATNYRTGRENRLRWLYDIHLLSGGLTGGQWESLATRASGLGLAAPFLDALQATERMFETTLPGAVLAQLAPAAAGESLRVPRLRNWSYGQRATWRSLPDLRTRLRWLRQLLVPEMAHLRVRYGDDGAGRLRVIGRRLADGWRRWRGYHRGTP